MSGTLSQPAPTGAAPYVASAPQPLTEMATPGRVSRKWLVATALLVSAAYTLLWSPWWYPLSDSSLYLIMARNLANGQGISSLAAVHKSVRPMTPILLSLIIRAGGGIGAMHAVMIVLTLTAHALCFVALRAWFNERMALLATLATAVSWWCGFSNAFTIMTEPLFLVMWWGAMVALNRVMTARSPAAQWGWVLFSILLLAGAWFNRVAGLLLVPGVAIGMFMGLRRYASVSNRLAWVAVLGIVFGVLFWVYYRKADIRGAESGSAVADVGEAKPNKSERYKWNVLIGVNNPLIQLPVTGGRWALESLAAVFNAPHVAKSKVVRAVADTGAAVVFVLTVLGGVRFLWRRRWWVLIAGIYFVPFWVGWGTRVKPRYMAPVLPLVFIALWEGLGWAILRLIAGTTRGDPTARRKAAAISAALIFGGAVLLNAAPYVVELYVRHAPGRNFYDLARRGGFAELVDIGAYLQAHAKPDDIIWENKGGNRRIVNFLTTYAPDTVPGEVNIDDPNDQTKLRHFFQYITKQDEDARYAIVFFNAIPWPTFHLPFPTREERQRHPRWWQLYERNPVGEFKPVNVPVSRDYVRDIPGVERD